MNIITKVAIAWGIILPLISCQSIELDSPDVEGLQTTTLDTTSTTEITDTDYTTDALLTGGNYRFENVTVEKDASLTINADGYVQISGNFSVGLGSRLTIE